MSSILSITYKGGAAVSQSDTVADPAGPFAAFEAASGSGNVKITCLDGSTITVYATQGLIVPIEISRVWSTGTTGSLSIVGLYPAAPVF